MDDVVVETMAEVLVVTGVEVIELVWEVVICDELVVDGIVMVVEPFS